ncbi:MAG: hypothetical protein IPK01_11365 [Acidobacteria bacterium]|nr:hypothetical protein [Acidobacteriota bacterium]
MWLFTAVYVLLPNLSNFSFIANSANGDAPTLAWIGSAAAYALVYDVIIMTITGVIFSRRNFK